MKKTLLALLTVGAFLAFSAFSALAADPLIYVDFDEITPTTLNSGDTYPLDSYYERGTSVTAVFIESINGDGVVFGPATGDGINGPNSAGPQGGQVMFIDAGSPEKEEGLNWELSSYYPIMDFTVEVVFWLATNNNSGNDHPSLGAIGIQNIWSSSWPTGSKLQMELRNIGNAALVGRPADSQKLEVAAWQPDGTEVRVVSTNIISAPAWHTCQVLFDYNESDVANCSITMYLDGVLQGSVVYDATDATDVFDHSWAVFGTPVVGARSGFGNFRFQLGMSMSHLISGTDNRGLQGAIDAFALSEGLLSPSQFVLPGGFNPPPPPTPTAADPAWQVYR
ncbi:MAG: hypothetical protein Kow0059_10310 [Candidatus Sumerlaeia bacterium]